jgi:Cu(I)/Ag(I) efflux system membrane fusion protein
VAADETRVHRVTALVDGVVRHVSSYAAGNRVRTGDLLARYFVSLPEVYNAMQSYFVAMNTLEQGLALSDDQKRIDQAKAQVRLSEELLETYGMSETQIQEVARTRQVTRDIEFRSPATGLVLSRTVAIGQRAERGAELFRIADLSRVWVLADLYENDGGLVRPGARANIRYQGRAWPATVGTALQFDAASRTLKVRLELDNPGMVLLPDMFVDVEFEIQEPEGISVPADALLDAGRRKVVFVAASDGGFEPREVSTGARFGDRVQILDGLKEGETLVVSGLFLLDSESRLQMAAAEAAKPPAPAAAAHVDPVCGMEVEPADAKYHSSHGGAEYYFCSKACKQEFDGAPARFARKAAAAKGGQS